MHFESGILVQSDNRLVWVFILEQVPAKFKVLEKKLLKMFLHTFLISYASQQTIIVKTCTTLG